MEKNGKKSFISIHVIGLLCAIFTIIAGYVADSLYSAYSSPINAQIAANQAVDSNTAWALHQVIQNGIVYNIINIGTLIIFILFLLPSIIDIAKSMNKS